MKTLRLLSRTALAVAAMAACASLSAADFMPATAAPNLAAPAAAMSTSPEDLLRGELKSVLVRMVESGAFANTAPEDIALSLSVPSERVVDLGLVVDTRAAPSEGVVVVGTSPGGAAQSLGVQAGDVIVAANAVDLSVRGSGAGGANAALAALKAEVERAGDGGVLSLSVKRNGGAQRLQGTVASRFIPAVRLELGEGTLVASTAPVALPVAAAASVAAAGEGCGRISTFHIAPRSQDLYGARLLSIDGWIPGPSTQNTYRVSAGRHVLSVAELIDDVEIPTTYSRARRNQNKTFEIVVEPNTTYLVSAHFNKDQRQAVASGKYWDPVVWKEQSEACR